MKKIKYANDEITVVWTPELCWHTTICFTQLPEVFDPEVRKWVDPFGASNERIIEQVNKCPSGALTFFYNDEKLDNLLDEQT
jgi:putative redox protein